MKLVECNFWENEYHCHLSFIINAKVLSASLLLQYKECNGYSERWKVFSTYLGRAILSGCLCSIIFKLYSFECNMSVTRYVPWRVTNISPQRHPHRLTRFHSPKEKRDRKTIVKIKFCNDIKELITCLIGELFPFAAKGKLV